MIVIEKNILSKMHDVYVYSFYTITPSMFLLTTEIIGKKIFARNTSSQLRVRIEECGLY